MTGRAVSIAIERIVFDGLDRRDANRAAAAFEAELARLLEGGAEPRTVAAGATLGLSVAARTPEAIGREMARGLVDDGEPATADAEAGR